MRLINVTKQEENNFWMKPNGSLINVGRGMHDSYAREYLESLGEDCIEIFNQTKKYPYQILFERGWIKVVQHYDGIHILGETIDLTQPMINTIDPKMTNAQFKKAKMLCDMFNTTIHKAINDQIFW